MAINQPQYVLDLVFFKYTMKDGSVIYWQECVLHEGMSPDEVGYLWVYEDGETFHSYSTPEQVFG